MLQQCAQWHAARKTDGMERVFPLGPVEPEPPAAAGVAGGCVENGGGESETVQQ